MKVPGERTRLCVVTPAHSSAQTGGAEYQIDCLLQVLAGLDRYDIHYLARLVGDNPVSSGYQVVRIGKESRSPRFGYCTDIVPLYRALKDIKPHVIYQRVACGYTGIAALYSRRRRARMIWHMAHDSDAMRESLIDGRNPIRQLLEKRSIAFGIRYADQVIAQTKHQSRLLQTNFHRTADAVIPNFQPAPVGSLEKEGPIKVLWIASLKPWKQPDVFIRLAERLKEMANVQFQMVGPSSFGPRERAWTEGLMASIASVPNLQYLGPRTQSEVNGLLSGAHVFVNTSLQEGFPNTFIQAWMREVPVVSLCVDPDDILAQGQVGLFAGTEDRLVECVRFLCANTDARRQMGARAKAHAISNHSLENAKAIAEMLDGHGMLAAVGA